MFSDPTDILDELNSAQTEFSEAVELILCAAGKIDDLAMTMPGDKANQIRSAASCIFLACGIHDIAGENLEKMMSQIKSSSGAPIFQTEAGERSEFSL